MKGLGKATLTGLILSLYMPAPLIAQEPPRDTVDELADGPPTQTRRPSISENDGGGIENTSLGVEQEKMRHELDYLKNVNIQMMRRIKALERELGNSVSNSNTPAMRQSAGAPTNPPDSPLGKVDAEQEHVGVVKKPKKAHAVEDLVLEEHTLFNQTFSLELGFEYSHFDQNQLVLNGFLALDAIFLGDLSVDEIEGDIFKTNLVARWGVTDRLQLSLNAPWVYRETTSRSRGVDLSSIIVSEKTVDDSDIGDIALSASYQMFPETLTRPDIVLNLAVKAPTGRDPYGINFLEDPSNTNLVYPEELPTGTGLWALSAGVSFLKTTDPSILFASVFYTHYLEKGFSDIGADPGAPPSPGDVQLGDELQIAAGIAFALNDRTSLSMSFSQKFIEETEITQPGLGTREIIGSDTTAGKFDIGLTYALTERLSLVTSLGMGLTNDSSDYTFNLKFPYRF
ncbi:MAG TPA: hypothetical protein DCF62_11830 [Porticoccaceae bacterium]|nr:hypothetical protein [Porticoccaceae bacterium]